MRHVFSALLFAVAVAGCTPPTESNGVPVGSSQMEYWTRFQQMRLGSSREQIERLYGRSTYLTLEYASGVASFENERLQSIAGPNYQDAKPDWQVEPGEPRQVFEAKLGKPTTECTWYYIDGFENVFCFEAGKLTRKFRILRPLV
jgi:outer membrane protein assembly factor BamE (lipoprotein component of BamABCDE complex)